MEPGLSSRATFRHWPEQPSSRLTLLAMGNAPQKVKRQAATLLTARVPLCLHVDAAVPRRSSRAASKAFIVAMV